MNTTDIKQHFFQFPQRIVVIVINTKLNGGGSLLSPNRVILQIFPSFRFREHHQRPPGTHKPNTTTGNVLLVHLKLKGCFSYSKRGPQVTPALATLKVSLHTRSNDTEGNLNPNHPNCQYPTNWSRTLKRVQSEETSSSLLQATR